VSENWEKDTIDDLTRQRADLDRLIEEAQRIRADITEHLERLKRGDLPARAALPEEIPGRPRKPS
jgi:hypothetical protein